MGTSASAASLFLCSLRQGSGTGRWTAGARKEEHGEQEDDDDPHGHQEGGAERDTVPGAAASGEAGDVAAEDIGVAGEGLVALIHGVAVDHGGGAGDARLGVDDRVAADDGGVSGDVSGDSEIAEQDEDVAGEVTLDLHGAEETGRIADLLPVGDKDVLTHIGAVCVRMGGERSGGLRGEGGGDDWGEQKEGGRAQDGGDRQRRSPFGHNGRRWELRRGVAECSVGWGRAV